MLEMSPGAKFTSAITKFDKREICEYVAMTKLTKYAYPGKTRAMLELVRGGASAKLVLWPSIKLTKILITYKKIDISRLTKSSASKLSKGDITTFQPSGDQSRGRRSR